MPSGVSALVGAAGGLLYWLALPKADQGWVAWGCLVPCLFLVLRGRCNLPLSPGQTAVAGLSFGLISGLGRVYWVAGTLQLYGGLGFPLACLTTALLILYLAAYPALFLLLCRRLPRTSGAFPWLAACLWTLLDWVQTWMLSGFPWELLGYTQYRYPAVAQMAAVTGVHGITFLIVLVNAGAAQAIVQPFVRLRSLLAPGLLVSLCVAAGFVRLGGMEETSPGTLRIGIVQGNVPQGEKWLRPGVRSATDHYSGLTRALVREKGSLDLILWPETALPFRLDAKANRHHRRQVEELARDTGTPLLVGSLGSLSPSGQPGLYNRSFLIGREGTIIGSVDKVHLVPFGEFLPLPRIFGYLRELTVHSGRFDPGEDHKVMPLPGVEAELGVFICYESIFPSIPRTLAARGATLLVNTTNDAWFGTSAAPMQHLAMCVMRAVETGRPVLRAANTGISCIIEPSGRIRERTRLLETETIAARVQPRGESTIHTRWGDWVFLLSAAVLGAWTLRRGRFS
ncbi:MAG: apolipoprotein N-acyltransferase [Gemmatimonadaceae bacterium]|nr:apolipoprotein N-acyltransferase [Gemmatimonadaceae bacterium]